MSTVTTNTTATTAAEVVSTLGGTAEGREAVVAQALRTHQVPTST